MKIILLALLCRQLTIFSQFAVMGTVKDETGAPLVGANVLINQTFKGTVTDLDGEFILSGLKPGRIVLKISFLGYIPVEEVIQVDKDITLDFNLTRNVLMADEVVVTATRANNNIHVAQTLLVKEDIKNQNQGQDVPYMLAMTPSLVTSSDGGSGVGYTSFRIRGTDLNRINVTMNGVPLNDSESHGVWWVDLPDFASSVENIQVQRGVGTSSVGSGAFGASINFQTFALNKDPYGEINSAYGSFNTWKNTVSFGSGLMKDHFTFDARLSKISSDGYIDRASSNLKSFHVSGAYYDQKNLIKVNIFSGAEITYQAWDGIPSDILKTNRRYNNLGAYTDNLGNTRYYDNQTDNYQQDHYQIQYSRELNTWLNFNVALHYTKGKGYYEEFKEGAKLADYNLDKVVIKDSAIAKSNLVRRKWLDNDFYGITYSVNYQKGKATFNLGGGWNNYYGQHYGNVIWAQYMSNGSTNHQYYYSDGNKTDMNVFGKFGYQLTDEFSAFIDLQARSIVHDMVGEDDDHRVITQKHTFRFFNPKAGLNYKLGETQLLYGFWGIARREPNRSNFVDSDPSKPVPTSEKLVDFELGYSLSSETFKANVNFYYMDYYDQLVLTGEINDVGSGIMTNVPRSYRRGVEISLAYQPIKVLSWNGNVNLSNNKIKKYVDHIDNWNYWDDTENQPLQYVQDLGETDISFSQGIVAASQFQYRPFESVTISLNSKYVGRQFIDNTSNSARVLDPYFINDLRFNSGFDIKGFVRLETIFSMNNIFNTSYETNAWLYQYMAENDSKEKVLGTMDGFFPQAGRNYMFSLVLKF